MQAFKDCSAEKLKRPEPDHFSGQVVNISHVFSLSYYSNGCLKVFFIQGFVVIFILNFKLKFFHLK